MGPDKKVLRMHRNTYLAKSRSVDRSRAEERHDLTWPVTRETVILGDHLFIQPDTKKATPLLR